MMIKLVGAILDAPDNEMLLALFLSWDFSATAVRYEEVKRRKQAAERRQQVLKKAGVSQEVLDEVAKTELQPHGTMNLADVITDVEMERRLRAHPLFQHTSWSKHLDYLIAYMWVIRYEKAFEQGADPSFEEYERWIQLMEERYAKLME
jgi:hypothetical protein